MIRLIALDLDGTLLDPAGRITQASKDAIARARAAGVRVVLNTGRPIQEAVWFAGEAGCDALLSCLGGAAVVDGVRGETLRRWDMPEESGRRALELCLGREIELMIFAGEEIVVDPFSKESLSRTYPFPIFHSAAVVAEDPRAYLEERGLPLTKVHGDWNQARYPLEELGRRGGQRQRPVYAPGGGAAHRHGQCPGSGAGGGPADRPLQPGGGSSLGHLPLSGGK